MAYADQSATSENTTYRTAHWDDLIPEDDLDALVNPPMYLMEIEDAPLKIKLEEKFKTNLWKIAIALPTGIGFN